MEDMKLIYIRWVDCWEPDNSWHSMADVDELTEAEWIVEQTGWVYSEDENYIRLINMVTEDGSAVAHITKIPKPWLLYKEEIKLKWGRKKKKNEEVSSTGL